MKVFCDYHHVELFESLRILFEDRLGWELYRPIGLDWHTNKYWSVFKPIFFEKFLFTARTEQLLALDNNKASFLKEMQQRDPRGDYVFKNINQTFIWGGLYSVETLEFPGQKYKAITFDYFKKNKFDIIVSSMYDHVELFEDLKNKYQPQAKHIFQAGNNWPPHPLAINILSSSKTYQPFNKDKSNIVYYHQEFKLLPPIQKFNPKSIYNIMHFTQQGKELFFQLEEELKDWKFKYCGAGNRDKMLGPDINVINNVFQKEMGFLWHVKKEGDGYGYNIHRAASQGIPIITYKDDFKGMTAESLLDENYSCIDLSNTDNLVNRLKEAVFNYKKYSNKIYLNFINTVDFDYEFRNQLTNFFSRLL